ncbi:glutathionylspermidine synthase family protein [Paenibacillus albus]|uniref:Glutathionylspermidine synthase n=1 Tax=Paenibacillus albus TaxID=2495582 RepID=A0A3S9ADR8_9BACL|nr:glutathionylspermidine synthase family protein [Paenibacillus albus]AZN43836.1 glutathionylspermidine synthase [Paenibacillus albus]
MVAANRFEIVGTPHQDRASRVAQLRELGFSWADLAEEPYWIDQIVTMPRPLFEELEAASGKLWLILDKTARYIHGKPEFYELLGIPEVLWDALDILPIPQEGLISRYARFDFAISNEGAIKLLELNADTPTGYVEASIATPWLCKEAGIASPNAGMAQRVAEAWGFERPEVAACVGYGEHMEDSGTIEALVKHSGLQMRCVDCLELWVDEGVLKDGEGRMIRSLFALYPKEWMAVDEGGEALAYAIESGNLTIYNGIHSILLQSKGLLATVWGLYELGLVFDEKEREAISRYMLPAYNNPVFEGSFVSKSMFGREGGSVRLFNQVGELELADVDGYDTSELFPLVYQKRAELSRIETAVGELHLLTGMFVINGVPCGMLGRAGGPITGNTSYFVAIGVREV